MTFEALASHILFGIFLFCISAGITRAMAFRVRVLDIPNARSSHDRPTPRAGGLAIITTFLLGIGAVYLFGDKTPIQERYFLGFIIAVLAVAIVAFLDDINYKNLEMKLGSQLISTTLVIGFGIVVDVIGIPWIGEIELGAWAYPLTFFWIMGLMNAYNFMDGLDGLAGGVGAIVCVFFCYITFSQGSTFVYIICYAILAGILGFLVYNFPPAKIFMGDVGSAFLGFVFATMAVIAARFDHSHTSFFVMPLLLLHFIFDTFFTFVCRWKRGETLVHAHRSHLYQLLNQLGWTHLQVCLLYYAMTVLQGIGAITMLRWEGNERVLVFLPFLLGYSLCAAIVIDKARKADILHSPKPSGGSKE